MNKGEERRIERMRREGREKVKEKEIVGEIRRERRERERE